MLKGVITMPKVPRQDQIPQQNDVTAEQLRPGIYIPKVVTRNDSAIQDVIKPNSDSDPTPTIAEVAAEFLKPEISEESKLQIQKDTAAILRKKQILLSLSEAQPKKIAHSAPDNVEYDFPMEDTLDNTRALVSTRDRDSVLTSAGAFLVDHSNPRSFDDPLHDAGFAMEENERELPKTKAMSYSSTGDMPLSENSALIRLMLDGARSPQLPTPPSAPTQPSLVKTLSKASQPEGNVLKPKPTPSNRKRPAFSPIKI